MIIFQRIPDYINENYISWKSDTIDGRKQWLNRTQKAEGYYYNDTENTETTLTKSQLDAIRKNTDIPVSMNFLYPICNQNLALLAQTKPSTRTVSLDGRAKDIAFVLDKMKHGVLYTSNANVETENAIKDMLIGGIGFLTVDSADFYNEGIFGLKVSHVPYDEVILDINAKKKSLEDMEGYFIEREFTLSKVMQVYGDILSQITDENGNPVDISTFSSETWVEGEKTNKQSVVSPNWNTANKMTVREYYEKVPSRMYLIKNQDTGVTEYFFEENLPLESQTILGQADEFIDGVYVRKHLIFGDYEVWAETQSINDYSLVGMFFEWGGKPYRSYGMIHYNIGPQEASDKILHIMLLNGILQNNAGWKAPKGSIPEEDRRKWEDYANNPRVVKEYVPVVREGKIFVPERESVEQLSNFYPMVLQMLKSSIEYSSGINAVLQGDAKEAGVDVFSALQQYQNAAMMRIQLSSSHINEAYRQLGQVLIQHLLSSITPDSYYFFDDKGNLNELKVALDTVNQLKKYKYLVVAIPSTAMPTQRLAVGTELMKIAQSSPDPSERSILTQKALELSDIKEYDDIKEQIDAVKNSENKIKQLEEAYNRLLETSKQMENKYINISLENRILKKVSDSEARISSQAAQAETEIKLASQLASAKIQGKQETKGNK